MSAGNDLLQPPPIGGLVDTGDGAHVGVEGYEDVVAPPQFAQPPGQDVAARLESDGEGPGMYRGHAVLGQGTPLGCRQLALLPPPVGCLRAVEGVGSPALVVKGDGGQGCRLGASTDNDRSTPLSLKYPRNQGPKPPLAMRAAKQVRTPRRAKPTATLAQLPRA